MELAFSSWAFLRCRLGLMYRKNKSKRASMIATPPATIPAIAPVGKSTVWPGEGDEVEFEVPTVLPGDGDEVEFEVPFEGGRIATIFCWAAAFHSH